MTPIVSKWLTNNNLSVKHEFSTPWGLCDLVGVSFSKSNVSKRLRLHQKTAIGPLVRVAIFGLIPDETTGESVLFDELAAQLSPVLTEHELDGHISRLLAQKFVRFENGGLQKLNGWFPLHKRIVTAELKLERLEEVFYQAASHTRFATESYVGLPSEAATKNSKNTWAKKLRSAGVGLLAVDRLGCRVLIRARAEANPSDPTFQAHCVERFWRTTLEAVRH
jgi:hypothetical protein